MDYPVPLAANVLWVGTMNEDETTKSLSDKVIDRGNLISFPRPRRLMRRRKAELQPPVPLLHRSVWEAWCVPESDLSDKEVSPYKEVIEQISEHLSRVGRALGHRVWQSVEAYLVNHPGVIAARAEGDGADRRKAMQLAFEDALVHKVMPKLRGIETRGQAQRQCLDPIERLLENPDLGLRLGEDFQLARQVGYGSFVWSSACYLGDDEPAAGEDS